MIADVRFAVSIGGDSPNVIGKIFDFEMAIRVSMLV